MTTNVTSNHIIPLTFCSDRNGLCPCGELDRILPAKPVYRLVLPVYDQHIRSDTAVDRLLVMLGEADDHQPRDLGPDSADRTRPAGGAGTPNPPVSAAGRTASPLGSERLPRPPSPCANGDDPPAAAGAHRARLFLRRAPGHAAG